MTRGVKKKNQGKAADELRKYFDVVDEDKRRFALDALDEYLYFRGQIEELKKTPLIQIDRKNPMKQKVTAAGKLLKEYSQVVDAKRGTLLRILYRVESSAADELLEKLKEFEA